MTSCAFRSRSLRTPVFSMRAAYRALEQLRTAGAMDAYVTMNIKRMHASLICCCLCTLLATQATLAADQVRRYELENAEQGNRLVLKSVARPTPGTNEVLVRIRAVSLNHRDLYGLQGMVPGDATGRVLVSDGAGGVIAIGPGVTRFKTGDRVATTFFERWNSGAATIPAITSARGGDRPGVLAEMITSHEDGLVKIPDHLSSEEGLDVAVRGCHSLEQPLQVLIPEAAGIGTARRHWRRVDLWSAVRCGRGRPTDNHELKRCEAGPREVAGATATVNYRAHPDWEKEVLKATGGAGVSHVLEIGGKDTLPRAVSALGLAGHIALIGGLTGFDATLSIASLTGRMGSMTSVDVGSREDFEAMNAFIVRHRIKPVIDKVLSFEEAPAAFDYLKSGSHFGKVVIRL